MISSMNPLELTDFYKADHRRQYPNGTETVFSNLTPRKSRIEGIDKVVFFGLQYFVKEYLQRQWNDNFFKRSKASVVDEYAHRIQTSLGKDAITFKHVEDLHDLGYLPICIYALPEGSRVPIKVPPMGIWNTKKDFFWLTNYLETILSLTIWGPSTSATIADAYRRVLNKYADLTVGNHDFVQWQGHDFSMRGMFGLEAACLSGAGHLLSFTGTDTIPAIGFLEQYYNAGMIPNKYIEGDYVTLPTYEIGAAIDWSLRYAKHARWNVVLKAMQVLESMFVKKLNDDGWHTLLAAGVDRNILVYDSDASAGQFTKRLVSLMKVIMRRNSGGNSTSVNRGKLTDIYMSPEGVEDIRNWGVDQIDEVTRREIFQMADGTLNRVFGVNLHELDELGESQEYQTYFTSELGASLQGADVELVVGFDLSKTDSFVMPVRTELEIYEDDSLHRQRRHGYYGWLECGFGVLDNRRVILGSF